MRIWSFVIVYCISDTQTKIMNNEQIHRIIYKIRKETTIILVYIMIVSNDQNKIIKINSECHVDQIIHVAYTFNSY